jgi:DUF4097 and DUF4098 domain-containing protein YvlB
MKYFILMLFANICFAVNAQNNSDREPYLTKSFTGESIKSVHAETTGGNISVTATDADSKVEVYVWQNNERKSLSGDELKTKVNDEYDINISVNNSNLTVTAKPKHKIKDWKNSLSFSFKIYVPENTNADLVTSGGNINLKGLSGDKDFTTSGGNLNLEDIKGKTKGRTSGGNISLKNSKDDLDLSTSGGNIYAKNSSGDINITTSGGSIKMNDLNGKIKASTSGGNVEGETIEGDLSATTSGGNVSLHNLNCSLKAATSAGNIDITIKKLVNYVSINNSAGKVNLELPKSTGVDLNLSAMKISTQTLENFSGTNSDNEIKGTVNGGGVPVTVDAGSGKIHVVFN